MCTVKELKLCWKVNYKCVIVPWDLLHEKKCYLSALFHQTLHSEKLVKHFEIGHVASVCLKTLDILYCILVPLHRKECA